MSNLEQSCLLLELALSLKANGSWAGETHVQKAGYFLNDLLNVPTGMDFILYKHGPFSFDLRELLTDMEANGFIKWHSHPPYGPSLGEGELGGLLREKFNGLATAHKARIEFIAKRLGPRNVASLERLATALYVSNEGYEGFERVKRIVDLKPHVDGTLAEKAIEEFDLIRTEAEESHLVYTN